MKKLRVIAAVFAGIGAFALSVQAGDFEDQLRKAIDPALKRLNKDEKPAQDKPPSAPANAAQDASSTPEISPFGHVSAEDERKIGRQIAGNLLGAAPLVKDAKLQLYVNKVGRWVAQHSTRPDLNWTFGVIETSDINAFAAPGG
jgi:predicted Zn-dependent protease